MSRTAATTFSRLIFHEEPTTARKVITTPRQYATTMLRGSTCGVIEMSSPKSAACRSAIPTAAATPSAAPTRPASTAYPAPSATNCWINCPRCVPTARAMPISERRSAASIVKIRTISRMPAAIEKSPRAGRGCEER